MSQTHSSSSFEPDTLIGSDKHTDIDCKVSASQISSNSARHIPTTLFILFIQKNFYRFISRYCVVSKKPAINCTRGWQMWGWTETPGTRKLGQEDRRRDWGSGDLMVWLDNTLVRAGLFNRASSLSVFQKLNNLYRPVTSPLSPSDNKLIQVQEYYSQYWVKKCK